MPVRRIGHRAGKALTLTPLQYELLVAFLRHPYHMLTREQFCELVWAYPFDGESNFVDVAVMELRRKLESGGGTRLIQTVRASATPCG